MALNLQKLLRDQNNRNDISIRLQLQISSFAEKFLSIFGGGFRCLGVRMKSIYTQLQKHRICNWIIHIKINKYLQAMKQRRVLFNLFLTIYTERFSSKTYCQLSTNTKTLNLPSSRLKTPRIVVSYSFFYILIRSLWWKQILLKDNLLFAVNRNFLLLQKARRDICPMQISRRKISIVISIIYLSQMVLNYSDYCGSPKWKLSVTNDCSFNMTKSVPRLRGNPDGNPL